MELNAEQMKFALVCHADWNDMCEQCPYTISKACGSQLARDALAFIKELTGENERLEKALVEQSAENVMLCQEVKHIRAVTVRKMQSEIKERCIKGGIYPAFVASTIDQIAKEMLEGEK